MPHVGRVKIRFRTRAAGVFPFRFGGQTVAVGREIAGDARIAAAVAELQPLLAREFVAELHRVLPGHLLDGQVRAFEIAWIAPHHGFV
jgi:hypothetical protein